MVTSAGARWPPSRNCLVRAASPSWRVDSVDGGDREAVDRSALQACVGRRRAAGYLYSGDVLGVLRVALDGAPELGAVWGFSPAV